jgi:hypothetical protein
VKTGEVDDPVQVLGLALLSEACSTDRWAVISPVVRSLLD